MADYHRSQRWIENLPADIRDLVIRHKEITRLAQQRAENAERQVRDMATENKRLRVLLEQAKSSGARHG